MASLRSNSTQNEQRSDDLLVYLDISKGSRAVETSAISDSPLSGEYAGDMTPDTLLIELGVDIDSISDVDQGLLCDDYDEGYFAAVNGN